VIVVDPSVWTDVLKGVDSPPAATCIRLIESGEPVALTDVVLAEILQGLRDDHETAAVEAHLRAVRILRLQALEDFSLAAELSRTARRSGVTIHKTLDCLIAVPCVRAAAPLLHADTDFDRLASCTPLRIYELTFHTGPPFSRPTRIHARTTWLDTVQNLNHDLPLRRCRVIEPGPEHAADRGGGIHFAVEMVFGEAERAGFLVEMEVSAGP